MSKYDITDDMNLWDYSLYNMRQQRKDRVDALIKKYGFPIEEKNLLKEDFIEYDLLKPELEAMKAEKLAQKPTPHGSSLDDEDMAKNAAIVKAKKEAATQTDVEAELLRQIRENSTTHKELKPIPKREDTWIDKAAEMIATSDIARKAALAMQGAADSYINPAGLALRFKNYLQNGEFNTGIDHIEPKDKLEKMIEFAGEMLYEAGPALKAGKAAAKTAANVGKVAAKTAVRQYDRYQFGQAYKKVYKELLKKNPGEAEEIMATAHKLSGESTHIQRGAAAYTADGKLITQGAELKKATQGATKRNYGLTKEIGLHNMSEADVKALPDVLRKYEPIEITDSGKWVYEVTGENGKTRRIITALKEINGKLRRVVVSDYWVDDIKTPIRELLK